MDTISHFSRFIFFPPLLVPNSARIYTNERTRDSRYCNNTFVDASRAHARMHAHVEAYIDIDTSRAHQHVVSRYPMWVNVSRTCELACKTTIRVSWMKHRFISLSLSYPSTFLRQSERRFLRNLGCNSTDAADRTWEMGHTPWTKVFFSVTFTETLTIFR